MPPKPKRPTKTPPKKGPIKSRCLVVHYDLWRIGDPVSHGKKRWQYLTEAREYAKQRGYSGIRVAPTKQKGVKK